MRLRHVTAAIVVTLLWLAVALRGLADSHVARDAVSHPVRGAVSAQSVQQAASVPTVALSAATGATIEFRPQNGRARSGIAAQVVNLPHLVLYRDGALTALDERTLIVEVNGIEVPPKGVTLTVEIETQHGDPALGGDDSDTIPVWRESRWIGNSSGSTEDGVSPVFRHEFGAAVAPAGEAIPTPTDYFRFRIALVSAAQAASDPLHAWDFDYAFLMENQWTVPLPDVAEESKGAAPDELIVYYTDMFPFRQSIHDAHTQLRRADVPDYVHRELVPQMVEAFRSQTDDWGFPWYQSWTSYRPGDDVERLSVALSDGRTWFHGSAPTRGHAAISINTNGGENTDYDTLTDGLMSTFWHELFHNLQRNVQQRSGGDGYVDGRGHAWQFFTEGTAVLASAVGQPAVQLGASSAARAYMADANYFLGGSTLGDLNTSYERMIPYHAALYWRFVYEQCGGMGTSGEDAAAGMEVARRALLALYAEDIVDIEASRDLVENLPTIMDRVLADPSVCPFQDYEESLTQFARAIYALRLDGGRCLEAGSPAGCRFYDPHSLYHHPRADVITYTGTTITYDAPNQPYPQGIPSSFGMDFVEVVLDCAADGQGLTLEFYGAAGAAAEFNVQLWKLVDSAQQAGHQRAGPDVATPETLTGASPDGHLSYTVAEIDTAAYNRLGLIITRVDAAESSDPVGEYTLVLHGDGE